MFRGMDAILVGPGFGGRGIGGKIRAARYARENRCPTWDLAWHADSIIREFARDVCDMRTHSTEFNFDTPDPVVGLITES